MDQFGDPDAANDDSGGGFGIVPRYLGGQLTAYEIAVYVALSWSVDADGTCRRPLKQIGDDIGCSPRTVRRVLDEMMRKGIIEQVPRYDQDGAQLCHEYRLIGALS